MLLAVVYTHSSGHHGGWPELLIGIVFAAIGAANAVKPTLSYRASRWQFKNPDALAPSAAALMMARVVGVIFVVIGIWVAVRGISSM